MKTTETKINIRDKNVSSNVIVITDSQFETEVLNSETPVLVYFWAPWCGPCKLVSPSVDAMATIYSDRLKVVKMEIDPNPLTVKQYQVEGVPALLVFKNNNLLANHEGAITKIKLTEILEPLLS
jgi:thioredoxin 1